MGRDKLKQYEGFQNLDVWKSADEQAIEGMVNEMNLPLDESLINARKQMKLGELYNDLKGKFGNNKRYDHKPVLKEIASSYYHKEMKDKDGKPQVIYGFKIPGDNETVYDYDVLSNIHYGIKLKRLGIPDGVTELGSRYYDLRTNGTLGSDDIPAVRIGMELAKEKKNGEPVTMEDIFRKLKEHPEINKYPAEKLQIRSELPRPGESLEDFAKRHNVSEDVLKKMNSSSLFVRKEDATSYSDQASLNPGKKIFIGNEADRKAAEVLLNQKTKDEDKIPTQQTKIDVNKVQPWQEENVPEAKKPDDSEGIFVKNKANQDRKPDLSGRHNELTIDVFKAFPSKDQVKKSDLSAEDAAKSQQYLAMLEKENNPIEDFLYKDAADVTENEVLQAQKAANFTVQDPVMRRRMDEKIKAWYDHAYGTEPVKYDASGRMMQPELKVALPESEKGLVSKDGKPVSVAFREVADKAAAIEKISPSGIKSLQRGMNLKENVLKEDGVLGPKTVSQVKSALIANGADDVRKRIGIGGFETMVEANRKNKIAPEALKTAVAEIDADKGGSYLQQGLNNIGKNAEGFESLKEDNDVGEKTTFAFNSLKDDYEDDLKNHFRSLLA